MPDLIMDAGFYLRNPQGKRRVAYDKDGKQRFERIPSSAGRMRRHRAMLRADGHVVNPPLTSHSANLDLEGSQANYYRKKHAQLGWIPAASCPVALAMNGQIDEKALCQEVRNAIRQGDACQRGTYSEENNCPHFAVEKEARRERRRKETAEREAKHKSEHDQLLEAQRDTQSSISEAVNKMAAALETKGRKKQE